MSFFVRRRSQNDAPIKHRLIVLADPLFRASAASSLRRSCALVVSKGRVKCLCFAPPRFGGNSDDSTARCLVACSTADFAAPAQRICPPAASGARCLSQGTLVWATGVIGDMYNAAYAGGNYTITHKELSRLRSLALGIGVEHGHWLRFDVTGGISRNIAFTPGSLPHRRQLRWQRPVRDMSAWIGLVNGYVDITTWRGITPTSGRHRFSQM